MPFDNLQQLIDAVENLQGINALKVDGTNSMLANLDAGNFKVVNVSDATDATDATNLQQVQSEISSAISQSGALKIDGTNSMLADLDFGGFRPNNVASGTASLPAYYMGSDSDTGIFSPSDNVWAVSAGGNESFRVRGDGITVGNPVPDSTSKTGRIYGLPYNNSDGEWLAIDIRGLNGGNELIFGGGSGFYNTATKIGFKVNSNTTTVSGVEKFSITSDGVGVGVTPYPTTLSNISFDIEGGGNLSVSSTTFWLQSNSYYNVGWKRKSTGYAVLYGMDYSVGAHRWYTTNVNSTVDTAISYQNQAIFDRDGIFSAPYVNASETYRMDNVDIVNTSRAWVGSGGYVSTGNVVINNTAPTIYLQDSNSRSSMIHCQSNIWYVLRGSGTNSLSWQSYNSQWPFLLNLENNDATFGGKTWHPNIRRSGGASATVNINTSGEMFVPASSIRYKENIKDLSVESSDSVLSLRPVTYTPKDEPLNDSGDTNEIYGLIAEEVFEVDPKLVYMSYAEDCYEEVPIADTLLTKTILKENSVPRVEGVHYDKIAVLLIDVVKRQREQIKLLSERLDNLEKLV